MAHEQDDTVPSESTTSAVSSQLVAMGLLKRPLDLAALFSTSTSTNSSPSALLTEQPDLSPAELRAILSANKATTRAKERAISQLVGAVFSLLESHRDRADTAETLSGKLSGLQWEMDKAVKDADKAKKDREGAMRDAEAEKARAAQAVKDLNAEKERHRLLKEDHSRLRASLQFVKTQSQHEQKRRDAELAAFLASSRSSGGARGSPLSSSSSVAGSSSTQLHILNPLAAVLSSSRRPDGGAFMDAEQVLLEQALAAAEEDRVHLGGANENLQRTLGTVVEWAGNLAAELGVAVPSGTHQEDADHTKLQDTLFHVRCKVVDLLSSRSSALDTVRSEAWAETERERESLAAERAKRRAVEAELDAARERAKEAEEAAAKVVEGVRREREREEVRVRVTPEEVDEREEQGLEEAEMQRRAKEVKKAALKARLKAAEEAKKSELARQGGVKSFLSGLGLDTPAVPAAGGALRSTDLNSKPTSSHSQDKAAGSSKVPLPVGVKAKEKSTTLLAWEKEMDRKRRDLKAGAAGGRERMRS